MLAPVITLPILKISLTHFAASLSDQEICSKLTDPDLLAAAGCTSTSSTPATVLATLANLLLLAVGILSVIMIIFSGFQIITSAGNPATVQKGKKTLTYAVIGLLISVLAYAITNFVLNLF